MAASFHVTVALPGKVEYEGEAASLVVPAALGYLGILAHHAPIVAGLTPGKITLRDAAGKITDFTLKSNGFLEFSGNKATLMLDSLELPA
jgi:F-type H+-transporting ATPase subunit epsilon